MKRAVQCPGCKLVVVLDDEEDTIQHEDPMCDEFLARVKAAGLKAEQKAWQHMVNPTTGNVKEPGQA